ncbi:uncharacterized protein LOC106176790 isoform X2 [Lingula anatina]|uniref:Uncharacterized protein LOC106176790 isoform X2 n=1 Tax=Lingula anatina TaxID=7574 RepID=A0A1S3JWU4_LINAN|nr:uncharacterized protein LOC106176790 isoform X2 [Lingula anatina]|eukprot:XP_013414777.1 uncharacterized protein LOC106176790 isoform X2 [Lingula anatina]
MSREKQPLLPNGFDLASLQDLDNDSDAEAAYESFRTDQGVPTFSQESDPGVTLSQGSTCSHQSQRDEYTNQCLQSQTDYDLTDSVLKENLAIPDSLSDVIQEAENMVHTQVLSSENFVQPLQKMSRPPLGVCNRNIPAEDSAFLSPVTPTKATDLNVDPLTPTANLKILISAASPEIRNRDNKKKELFKQEEMALGQSSDSWTGSESLSSDCHFEDGDDDKNYLQGGLSRKDKSLGLLCQRFLSKFPEYPAQSEIIEISLDSVAKGLGVERRRIYDIVNVLESVEVVSRQAKNKYLWHGKTNLPHTLARLKTLAKLEGFAEKIERMKEFEMSRDVDSGDEFEFPSKLSTMSVQESLSFQNQENMDAYAQAHLRKDRSLGIMSQKFLMLFLVSKPKMLNLDLSAKILIGDPNIDRTDGSKFKTKIRRLYDIANILTSLNLIKKVHVTEVRGRKPAFMYIGPDLSSLSEVTACSADGSENHRPSTKHSMLDCVMNPKEDKGRVQSIKQEERSTKLTGKKGFTRHSSFELICKAAEDERSKLYSNASSPGTLSRSQGNIPMTLKSLLDRKEPLSQSNMHTTENLAPRTEIPSKKTPTSLPEQQPVTRKRIVIIKGDKRVHIMQENIPSGTAVRKVTLTPVGPSMIKGQEQKSSEKIIIKTVPDDKGSGKVSVSKDQLTAVLQPVNRTTTHAEHTDVKPENLAPSIVTGEQFTSVSEAAVRRSKRTVQQHHLAGDFHYEMPGKKIKVDQQVAADNPNVHQSKHESQSSPENTCSAQDSEVANITQRPVERTRRESKGRPSPLRALHLQAEFWSSPPLSHLPIPPAQSSDVVTKVSEGDLELASPLPIEEQQYGGGSGDCEVEKVNTHVGQQNSCSAMHAVAPQMFMQTHQHSDCSVFKFPVQVSSTAASYQLPISPGYFQVSKVPAFFPHHHHHPHPPVPFSAPSQWYGRSSVQFMPGGFNTGPLHVIPPAEILSPPALSPFSSSPSPNSSSNVFSFGNPSDLRTPEAVEKRPFSSSSSMSQTSPLGDLSSLTPSISQVPLLNISPKNKSVLTAGESCSVTSYHSALGMATPQQMHNSSVSQYADPLSYPRTPGFVTPDSSQNIPHTVTGNMSTTARHLQLLNNNNNICG